MTVEWRERPLGDLTDDFDGIRVPVKEADRRAGPYPYYGASGVVDHVDNYLFDGEYLLIAEDGENLQTRSTPVAFLARGKFWVNNHAHIVRGNNEADTRFLMYALSSVDISGYLTGSTMPKLTQGNMNRIPVMTPPLSEQRAIADILGTLDDKIELNRRMHRTLDDLVCAQFERVCTRRAGPTSEGWRTGALADIADIKRSTIEPADEPDEVFEHHSIPAFDEGQTPKLERGSTIRSAKCLVPPGAVLISKLNPRIPRVWLPAPRRGVRSICSTEFLVLVPREGWSREFLYGLLASDAFGSRFAGYVTGTSGSHQRVAWQSLLRMEIDLPPPPVVQRFTEMSSPLLRLQANNREQIGTLTMVRELLLPKLLSGELRPRGAQAELRPTAG